MILAIETSDTLCSVGFWDKGVKLVEYNHELPMQHAVLIGDMVDNGLKFLSDDQRTIQFSIDDLELAVVATGPGSFTGLRIGMSYIQGFCFGRNLPVVGISNHQVLALQNISSLCPVYTLIEARQEEVYIAKHEYIENRYPEIIEHHVILREKLSESLPNNCQVIHKRDLKLSLDTIHCLKEKSVILNQGAQYSACYLAELGFLKYNLSGPDELDKLDPMYIRPFAGVQ
jgi:tRNA threonylcarbamoyladenosine biosynthesis protein TsaB